MQSTKQPERKEPCLSNHFMLFYADMSPYMGFVTKCLYTTDRAPMIDQNNDFRKVQL